MQFRVGKPRATLGLSANYNHPNGEVVVPWTTVRNLEGWVVAVPTTQLVVPRTGLYLSTVNIQRGGIASAAASLSVRTKRNGVDMGRTLTPAATTALASSFTWVEELAAGDALEVFVTAVAGAGNTAGLNALSFWSVVRVGPDRWTS